jgi:hypothetical protein
MEQYLLQLSASIPMVMVDNKTHVLHLCTCFKYLSVFDSAVASSVSRSDNEAHFSRFESDSGSR